MAGLALMFVVVFILIAFILLPFPSETESRKDREASSKELERMYRDKQDRAEETRKREKIRRG